MTGVIIPLSVEIADLAGGRAALVRGGPCGVHQWRILRFVEADSVSTEGEFRAAIGDAVVQILDELL